MSMLTVGDGPRCISRHPEDQVQCIRDQGHSGKCEDLDLREWDYYVGP